MLQDIFFKMNTGNEDKILNLNVSFDSDNSIDFVEFQDHLEKIAVRAEQNEIHKAVELNSIAQNSHRLENK